VGTANAATKKKSADQVASHSLYLDFAFISYLKFVRGRAWDKEEEQPDALLSPFEAGPEISLFLKLVRRSRTVSYGRY